MKHFGCLQTWSSYTAWMDAERVLLPGRLAWKTVSGTDYLYRIVDGRGNGRSLGRRSAETELQWQAGQRALQTADTLSATLARDSAMYRTLRLHGCCSSLIDTRCWEIPCLSSVPMRWRPTK